MIRFDRGVLQLSDFDPQSNSYQTRTLRLPDLPLLESLEHMFTDTATCTASPLQEHHSNIRTLHSSSSNDHCGLPVMSLPPLSSPFACASRRVTQSIRVKTSTPFSIHMLPRRARSISHLVRWSDFRHGTHRRSMRLGNHRHGSPVDMVTEEGSKCSRRRSGFGSESGSLASPAHACGVMRPNKRPKRSLSNAFQALTGLIQKKMRRQQHPWHSHTQTSFMRSSSTAYTRAREQENWWAMSPPAATAVCG